MNKKELQNWINNLPEEFDDMNIVFRNLTVGDDENWLALDKQIVSAGIDIGNRELYFCDNESSKLIEQK